MVPAVAYGLAAIGSLALTCGAAEAGGFSVREQSGHYQGLSFAGSASGGALSSMFWNPAATAVLPGLNTESAYSLILPEAQVTVTSIDHPNPGLDNAIAGFPNSTDIAGPAIVAASYAAYQLTGYDPNLFIGVGINSPFGLTTKPDDPTYQGAVLGRTTKLLTVNLNPNVAYRIAPGVIVGAGVQVQYADGKLKFAGNPLGQLPNVPSTYFRGDDVAFGATAGVLLQPTAGTSIGLGWRSQLTHQLEGDFGVVGAVKVDAEAELKLPDIVTLSLTQAIAPNARLLGTVEWSRWSVFKELRVDRSVGPDVAIDANWSDGWMFALGGEYDYSRQLTLRAGAAYEISPVDAPEKRITTIPDADRIWLSTGASYRWSESTTIDLAYTHIFLEDGRFERTSLTGFDVEGEVEASTDIITVGLKMKWGGEAPLK
ncbi:MAG: OmpP1/FadL family transporter [Hyphomicrobiaceae bacterium]|nr:OmpP1/FadL family transporter [Hyphomicrobiaceae bacterium]